MVKTTEEKNKLYFEAIGKRKRSAARVRLFPDGKGFLVNEKDNKEYFSRPDLEEKAASALIKMKVLSKFGVVAKVRGGGITGQAEAIRHGISRALVKFNPEFRKRLRRAGFLTRDPRKRERKKFGLRRARRARQWRKR